MNKFFTTMLTLAVVSLSIPALAQGCVGTTSDPEVDQTTDAGRFYVDNDLCQTAEEDACLFSIWIYQESNDIDGLQRGNEGLGGHDDTCGGTAYDADTIIF